MNKQGRVALALCAGLLAGLLLLVGTSARAQSSVLYAAPGGLCGGASPCYASIQEAVTAAYEGDTVKVAEGVYTYSALQVLSIDKGITVIGGYALSDWGTSLPDTRPTVLDATNVYYRRVIKVDSSSNIPVWLEGLVVQGGRTAPGADGAGVYVAAGTVVLHKCTIQGNSAMGSSDGGGGGVFLQSGTLTISQSKILLNLSARHGAGLAARSGTLRVEDSVIQDNTATEDGGGVFIKDVHLTLARSVIAGNTPIGVLVAGGTAIFEGNTIENNSSTGTGGGIAVNGVFTTSVTASHNLIRNNSATSGGGVGISTGSMALYGNEIVDNTATSSGGGVATWANGSEIILGANRIRQNTSGGLGGGGLYVGEGDVGLERNDIQQNVAPGTHGGAIVVAGGRVVGVNDVIARNQSEVEGVYVAGGSLVTRHWTLVSNGLYAVSSSGGAASFANTIVCSHTVAGFWGPQIEANVTLFYRNDTRCGDGATCVGDLTGTPLFVNIAAGDYHIGSTSVAIDKGIDAGVKRDMDLQPRFGTPDVGADEYWAPGTLRRIYVPLLVRSLP